MKSYLTQQLIQKIILLFEDQIPPEAKKPIIDFYLYFASYGIYTILEKYNSQPTLQDLLSSQLLTAAVYLNSEYFQGRIYGPLQQYQSYFTLQSYQASYQLFSQASYHSPQLQGLLCQEDTKYLPFAPTKLFSQSWYNNTTLYSGNIDYRSFVNYLCCLTFPGSYTSAKFVYDIMLQQQIDEQDKLSLSTVEKFIQAILNDLIDYYPDCDMELNILMSELLDDIRPKHDGYITLQDFDTSIACEYFVRFTTSMYSFLEREYMEQQADVKILDSQWNSV